MTGRDGGLPRDGDVGYFVSAVRGEVLDVERWRMHLNGAPVIVWHRKSTDVLNQRWSVRALNQGAFEISPLSGPGKALDQLKTPARYHITDATVQWDRHGRRSQQWTFKATGDGMFEIVNLGSGANVSYQGHGKQLLLMPQADSDLTRRWRFEPVTG